MLTQVLMAQNETYGFNEKAGKYLNVGDAEIYYEVYGQGAPILLLHGGLYGSISEYKEMIPALSQQNKVIAIATRGHGKSEIGEKQISYKLFAEDALAVLRNESQESAIVIGFSDGGITAYVLAAEYPDDIKKVVAIGGGLSLSGYSERGLKWISQLTPESMAKSDPDFVEKRKRLMPRPERWNEFIWQMKVAWLEPIWISSEKAKNIKCPVLTIGGDRDYFLTTEQFVQTYRAIPNSQLAIIPNSGHVESMRNPVVFKYFVLPFITE